jgi:propanol-preferring alcohol dehydrogenase
MRAAIFDGAEAKPDRWLRVEEVPQPAPGPGEVLLRVLACGVCRTDLHIVEGDLPALRPRLVPGHQIVGEVVAIGEPSTRQQPEAAAYAQPLSIGTRVGVGWMGGTDGTCFFCTHAMENLCDNPVFTGYTVDGGYADYACVRSDFCYPLPHAMDPMIAAPLLCAGVIGFRSLRVAGVAPGERVGLFGFGSSASLAIQVLNAWGCQVYVATRGDRHRSRAREIGAAWVGDEAARPPVTLDRAITFAPSGKVVVQALSCLRKGGVVAINAIHLDQMPAFEYDTLLWGERQIRSVANLTRNDAVDFLQLAAELSITPRISTFSLEQANSALLAARNETQNGSAVIVPS